MTFKLKKYLNPRYSIAYSLAIGCLIILAGVLPAYWQPKTYTGSAVSFRYSSRDKVLLQPDTDSILVGDYLTIETGNANVGTSGTQCADKVIGTARFCVPAADPSAPASDNVTLVWTESPTAVTVRYPVSQEKKAEAVLKTFTVPKGAAAAADSGMSMQ